VVLVLGLPSASAPQPRDTSAVASAAPTAKHQRLASIQPPFCAKFAHLNDPRLRNLCTPAASGTAASKVEAALTNEARWPDYLGKAIEDKLPMRVEKNCQEGGAADMYVFTDCNILR